MPSRFDADSLLGLVSWLDSGASPVVVQITMRERARNCRGFGMRCIPHKARAPRGFFRSARRSLGLRFVVGDLAQERFAADLVVETVVSDLYG